MKKLTRKSSWIRPAVYFLLVLFSSAQILWAGEPIPSVAQVPKDLKPVTDPQIPGPPALTNPMPLPESPLGISQNLIEFLKEDSTLSKEISTGITTGNLGDINAKDLNPLVTEDPQIDLPDPSSLFQEEEPVNPPPSDLLKDSPPSLSTEEVTLELEGEPVLQPIQEAEEKKISFPGLGGAVIYMEAVTDKAQKKKWEKAERKRDKSHRHSWAEKKQLKTLKKLLWRDRRRVMARAPQNRIFYEIPIE